MLILSMILSLPLTLSLIRIHTLSPVLVVMMKSKKLKTKIYSHAHSLILSLWRTQSGLHKHELLIHANLGIPKGMLSGIPDEAMFNCKQTPQFTACALRHLLCRYCQRVQAQRQTGHVLQSALSQLSEGVVGVLH